MKSKPIHSTGVIIRFLPLILTLLSTAFLFQLADFQRGQMVEDQVPTSILEWIQPVAGTALGIGYLLSLLLLILPGRVPLHRCKKKHTGDGGVPD